MAFVAASFIRKTRFRQRSSLWYLAHGLPGGTFPSGCRPVAPPAKTAKEFLGVQNCTADFQA
jgi:hypothetical protein